MSKMKIVNATLAMGIATIAGMAGAQAGLVNVGDQLSISGNILPGSDTGYVSYNGGTAIHCYAGAFNLTVKDTTTGGSSFTIQSFCTDVAVDWKSSDTYTAKNFAGQTGVDPHWASVAGIQDVAYLYNTYFVGQTLNADQDAGLQLAIWKVLYDSGVNGVVGSSVASFNSGKLQAWGFGAAAMNDALAYVTDVNTAINNGTFVTYAGLWLDPNDNNSQGLIYTPASPTGNGGAVPEPSTVFAASLLLLPLGVGIARTLRKQRI